MSIVQPNLNLSSIQVWFYKPRRSGFIQNCSLIFISILLSTLFSQLQLLWISLVSSNPYLDVLHKTNFWRCRVHVIGTSFWPWCSPWCGLFPSPTFVIVSYAFCGGRCGFLFIIHFVILSFKYVGHFGSSSLLIILFTSIISLL